MDGLFVCIDHVGLAVPDLDEAIKFHTEVMGWRVLHREENQEQGVAEAMIGTGDQLPQNAQVQLLAPLNENSTIAKWIERNGGKGGSGGVGRPSRARAAQGRDGPRSQRPRARRSGR